MTKQSANKKMRGKDLITIGIFSADIFCDQFCVYADGWISSDLVDSDARIYCCVCGDPVYADDGKGAKLGAVF